MKRKGFDYSFDSSACATCKGHCCMGEEGYIFVDMAQIENIARYMNMELVEFLRKHVRRVGNRFSLKQIEIEPGNHACAHFNVEKRQCSIYPVRPLDCRTYPFWEELKQEKAEKYLRMCPGIKFTK